MSRDEVAFAGKRYLHSLLRAGGEPVVIAPQQTYAGTQVYASDFLPGAHQGTLVVPGPQPVANIAPRVPTDRQALELAALAEGDAEHLAARGAVGLRPWSPCAP